MTHEVPEVLLWPIVIGYLAVAGQFFVALFDKRLEPLHGGAGRRGMGNFIGIFLLCAISGYLPGLVPVPYDLQLVSHLLLAVLTWTFVITNQARTIARSLGG